MGVRVVIVDGGQRAGPPHRARPPARQDCSNLPPYIVSQDCARSAKFFAYLRTRDGGVAVDDRYAVFAVTGDNTSHRWERSRGACGHIDLEDA